MWDLHHFPQLLTLPRSLYQNTCFLWDLAGLVCFYPFPLLAFWPPFRLVFGFNFSPVTACPMFHMCHTTSDNRQQGGREWEWEVGRDFTFNRFYWCMLSFLFIRAVYCKILTPPKTNCGFVVRFTFNISQHSQFMLHSCRTCPQFSNTNFSTLCTFAVHMHH